MLVRDVMTRNPVVIEPEALVEDAARKMRDANVGILPVHDGAHLLGMLTDRDIVVRAVAEGRDPKLTRVREVMTPEVISCFEDQDTREAARSMREHRVRRLAVLDRENRLVGLISVDDLAAEVWTRGIDEEAELAEELAADLAETAAPTRGL